MNSVEEYGAVSDSTLNDFVPLDTMQTAKTGIVSTIFGGAQAAVGDFAASTYNSLVPESMEVDTRDLIGRISDNALKVYDENPDAIHLASFVGGVFVPAGLALKGMTAARAGMKGINWFSKAGEVDQIANINNLIKSGQMATKEYQVATRNLYLRNFANNAIVDNAAAELAILGTMNAHPLMEDYVKDPLSSFGTSMMLGAAIVGPISHIAQRFEVRKLGMAAESEALRTILKDAKPVSVTEDLSMQVAQHQDNINNWENFLHVAGQSNEYNKLTTDLAESFVRTSKAAQMDAFNNMVSKEIRELPAEKGGDLLRAQLLDQISGNPELFSGINEVRFATAKEETSFIKAAYDKVFSSTAEPTKGIPLTKMKQEFDADLGMLKNVTEKDDMIFSPTFGGFIKKSDMGGYGVAADLVQSERTLTEGMTSSWYRVPNYEADLEKLSESAAYIDFDYLRKLKAIDEMSTAELANVKISPDDGPMLNAVLAKMRKMVSTGEDVSGLRVTITKAEPNWSNIEAVQLQKAIARNPTIAGGTGVSPTYLTDIYKDVESQWAKFSLKSNQPGGTYERTSLDSVARKLLGGWMGGGKGMRELRSSIEEAFRPSRMAGVLPSENAAAAKRIYESQPSKDLRAAFMKNADSEGYVWLYRGMMDKAFSSGTLESFTTNAAKAREFGTPKLYRVKVQDIFAGIHDIPGSAGSARSTEVLVLSPTRDAAEKVPIGTLRENVPANFMSFSEYGIAPDILKGANKASAKNLIANSFDDFSASNPLDKFAGTKEEWLDQAKTYVGKELKEFVDDVNSFKSLVSSNSSIAAVEADMSQLSEYLLQLKKSDIQIMANMGIPPEVIRTRTNTPLDTVKAVLAGADIDTLPTRLYDNAEVIGQVIAPTNRSLQVGTTMEKIPAAELRSSIQRTMLDDIDTEIKRQFLTSSKSTTLQDLREFLYSEDNSKRYQMLRDSLKSITNSALGSKFFQSSDFALRDMGVAGQIITAIGKDSAHLYNKYSEQLVRPISQTFSEIMKDSAAVVEFNIAREINASLKGERYYSDGKFYQAVKNPDGKEVMKAVEYKGSEFEITTPAVKNAFDAMSVLGREMYEMNSTYRQTLGMPKLSDMGFWMPAFNPRDKYITYVIDHVDNTTKLLYGYSPADLASAEKAFANTMTERSAGSWTFVRKGQDQQLYNKIENRHDPMFMSVSDATSLHGGSSALAITPTNNKVFSELVNGYEHYIHRSVANNLELQYSDVMQHLDKLSNEAQALTKGQPTNRIQQALNVPTDAGLTVKNTLLGRSNLKEYVGWQDAQNGIKTAVEMGLNTIATVMEPILNPAKALFGKGKSLSDKEYETLMKDLADRGIPNPFQGMDDAVAKERFHVEKISMAPNMTARLVALSNNFAATALLKVMELGQPLVNMMSLPILTSAAVQRGFEAEFMGAKLAGNGKFSTIAAMHAGIRYLAHPDYVGKYRKMGQDLGITTPVLSEANEIMTMSRSFNPGLMQKAENLLNSKTIDILSKPAIWSEQAVREVAFSTGINLAKRAYPGLGDAGVITFARNFVDTSIGNYSAAQRPTLFQGTIGAAMGLFQTYMVTLGQQMYRGFELRDYKMLMKMGLMQGSIFGAKSLPGFNQVSEMIGEHYSDPNYDLTTGLYRAVPEGAADIILYGMPSNLGPAVHTRGDIQPRIPNILSGVQNLASVQILKQAYDAAALLGQTTSQLGDKGATQAFAEALSIQSISRPVARLSELVTGHSVTRSGNQIAGPDEVYSTQGILARVFATRGLRETKAREAQYLNSMYNTIDRNSRQEAVKVLKNHIRSGTLTSEIAERIQEKYMRTGHATGWRSAVNTALHDTDSPGVSAVRNHLAPNAPMNRMIDDTE